MTAAVFASHVPAADNHALIVGVAAAVVAVWSAVLVALWVDARRLRRRATPPPAPVVPLRSSTTYRTSRPSAAELRAATVYVLPVARDRFDADATAVLRVLPGGRDAR